MCGRWRVESGETRCKWCKQSIREVFSDGSAYWADTNSRSYVGCPANANGHEPAAVPEPAIQPEPRKTQCKCGALVVQQPDGIGRHYGVWISGECTYSFTPAVPSEVAPSREQRLEDALRLLYEETKEYIEINHLGDPHHNESMKRASNLLEAK
jgi:hypothetical protein